MTWRAEGRDRGQRRGGGGGEERAYGSCKRTKDGHTFRNVIRMRLKLVINSFSPF